MDIKKENKELYKALQGENRKLMNDIGFYLRQFYIKDNEYHFIKNQILKDFHMRLKETKNIWESIDDPKEYCDAYLVGYKKKDISIFGVFKNQMPLMMFMFLVYMLSNVFFPRITINMIDSSMLEVRGTDILASIIFSLIPFLNYFDEQSKMFVRNKIRDSKDILIFLGGIFAYILLGKFLYEMVILIIPKILLYIGLGLSFIWMLVRRIMNYNRT